MSRNVGEQSPGSTLQACRQRETGLVVFVKRTGRPSLPSCALLEGGLVLPDARHVEAPHFLRNVVESVAEKLDLRPPGRLFLCPFQLHVLACSDSQ